MSKKDKQSQKPVDEAVQTEPQEEAQSQPQEEQTPPAQEQSLPQADSLKEQLAQQEDKYLRLFAEFDNYRKRTAKEKESIWVDAKADVAASFLPVYDNLERALKQETADEAFKKGVEMTMNQLKEVLAKLNVTEIPALGQTFDPNLHNAVMHVEDESLEENTVAEVFQAGFQCGEKVIRFAMVKVAN